MTHTRTRISALLAIGVLALTGCTGEDEPSADPTSTSPSAASDGGGAGSSYPTEGEGTPGDDSDAAQECIADDGDQEIPTEAPKTDAWPAANGAGVPVSNTFGPTNRDDDVWTCYSHSPTGALFAAAYIRGAMGDPAVREVYLDDPIAEEGATSANGTQLRGYKFTAHDEDSVSLELVYEASTNDGSALVAMPITVNWENDQWTVNRADLETAQPRQITGLNGYVEWSAST